MRPSRPVKMSRVLRQEIEHWLFLESWNGFLPWRLEKHSHVRLFSDSSSFAWGGVLSPDAININICDYWEPHMTGADISIKETSFLEQARLPFPFLSYRS